MNAFLFPGQGAQFAGMGADLYENNEWARNIFETANEILGFRISDLMFGDNADELKRTDITQPAIFIHSYIKGKVSTADIVPGMAAGHSLGEFSALTYLGALTFEDGLRLVAIRARAMEEACKANPGTMAAIIGLEDEKIEKICAEIDKIVVPANYNSPGQLVISGTLSGIEKACTACTEAGAMKAIVLQVGGAFHSPLMEPARLELAEAIDKVHLTNPICPVYQNVDASSTDVVEVIKDKLVRQLTSPVLWTQSMRQMISDGMSSAFEVGGSGAVLRGLLRKVDRSIETTSL